MRWESNFLAAEEHFTRVWSDIGRDISRKTLLILGIGFDPRCLAGLRHLIATGASPDYCLAVEYGSGRHNRDSALIERASINSRHLMDLLDPQNVRRVSIRTLSDDGRYVGGRRIVDAFNSPGLYSRFTDVIFDISSLPPGLYFPLLSTLLELSESAIPNLHVIVSDCPTLNSRIVGEGGDRAEMIVGFEGGTERAATSNPLPVWVPMLGEGAHSQLRTIGNHRDWTLIHPILPFPSRNPRRGDELVTSYHDLIFDEWQVEPGDFIYADEQNPFDVYRTLSNMALSVRTSLGPIGTPQMMISSHSSKLLSLGGLLAAFEMRLGVIHVQPTGYLVDPATPQELQGDIYEVWLTGEPYAAC